MNFPRTVYSTNVKLPAEDAQSKQILAMAEAFSKVLPPEHFTLLSPRFSDQPPSPAFHWETVPLPSRFHRVRYLGFFLAQPFYLLKLKAELVFTRDILVAVAGILVGARVCFEIHKAPKKSARFLLNVIRRSPRLRIVSISQALKNYLSDVYEIEPGRIFVAHDAVDLEAFQELKRVSKEALRRQLGLPVDKVVIAHPGRAARSRGFHAIEALMETDLDFLFLQIGGAKTDTAYWKARYADDPRIRFIEFLPQKTVFQYQAAADLGLFFLTKDTETWWCCSPLKIFEFMAAGTPILASGIGSVGEVLNPSNALLFDPEDSQALARGVRDFLENPEKVAEIRETASRGPFAQTSWKDRCLAILQFEEATLPGRLPRLVEMTS